MRRFNTYTFLTAALWLQACGQAPLTQEQEQRLIQTLQRVSDSVTFVQTAFDTGGGAHNEDVREMISHVREPISSGKCRAENTLNGFSSQARSGSVSGTFRVDGEGCPIRAALSASSEVASAEKRKVEFAVDYLVLDKVLQQISTLNSLALTGTQEVNLENSAASQVHALSLLRAKGKLESTLEGPITLSLEVEKEAKLDVAGGQASSRVRQWLELGFSDFTAVATAEVTGHTSGSGNQDEHYSLNGRALTQGEFDALFGVITGRFPE